MNRRRFVLISAAGVLGMGLSARYKWWMTRRLLIRLKLMRPPANLIRNAGFNVCTNPSIPDYWGTRAPALVPDWRDGLRVEDGSPVEGTRVVRFGTNGASHEVTLDSCGTFVPDEKPYTFSLFLRSDRERTVALSVGWGSKELVAVGKEWKRHKITRIPIEEAKLGYSINTRIWLREPGTVWVAAPQLEVGIDATEFDLALMDDHPLPELPWPDADSERVLIASDTKSDVTNDSDAVTDSHKPAGLTDAVQVDGKSRCLTKDGRAFIVNGIAVTEPDERSLDDIASHGFNSVVFLIDALTGEDADRARTARSIDWFELARRRGLHTIALLSYRKDRSLAQNQEDAVRTIKKLKNQLSILGWLVLDEPSRRPDGDQTRQRIADFYHSAKQADPERPVFINDIRWTSGHVAATDIGCVDSYPIGQFSNAVKIIGDLSGEVNADCVSAGKPSAFWLQMYGHGDAVREPTPEEERAMTYLAFIQGTRLFFYWVYKPMNALLWEEMKSLSQEMVRLEAIVTDGRTVCTRIGTKSRRVHYTVLESADKIFLVVCNAAPEPTRASFDLARLSRRRLSRCRSWYGAGIDRSVSSRLDMHFAGHERHVVELW